MKKVLVAYGQTILDIAIQEYADASKAVELCRLNNLSLNDLLLAGREIMVDVEPNKAIRELTLELRSLEVLPNSNLPRVEDLGAYVDFGYWDAGYTI